jgi:hypothetical protein
MTLLGIAMELTFKQTIWASVVDDLATAAFTAALVTLGAQFIVQRAQNQREGALHQEEQDRAAAETQLSKMQARRRQRQEQEFQSRKSLREAYASLLVMQRRSRQASLALSKAVGEARPQADDAAVDAHNDFLDEYHRLALDADRDMWVELRHLRKALDVMLLWAREGDTARCEDLYESARAARQNLERQFRLRLHHSELQKPKSVGDLTAPEGKSLL